MKKTKKKTLKYLVFSLTFDLLFETKLLGKLFLNLGSFMSVTAKVVLSKLYNIFCSALFRREYVFIVSTSYCKFITCL